MSTGFLIGLLLFAGGIIASGWSIMLTHKTTQDDALIRGLLFVSAICYMTCALLMVASFSA